MLTFSLMVNLTACSNDEDTPEPEPEYYNPLEGEWVKDTDPNLRIVFTDKFKWTTEYFEDEAWGHPQTKGSYTIDKDKSTFYCNGVTYGFAINGDKLTINYPDGIIIYTKYKEE